MILLIDNYDSFSYNLYQLVGSIRTDIRVIRNDEMTVEEIRQLAPDHIILSPGPGKPSDAGICEAVVRDLGAEIPILGVCLGHQAISEVYGMQVTYAKKTDAWQAVSGTDRHGLEAVSRAETGDLGRTVSFANCEGTARSRESEGNRTLG